MRIPFCVSLVLFLFMQMSLVAFAGSISSSRPLVVAIGRSIDWPTPPTREVSVAKGGVINITDRGPFLRISGRKLGFTQLRTGHDTIDVYVLPTADAKLFAAFSRALEGRRGLELSVESQTVTVTGRLLRMDDWLSLAKLSQEASASWRMAAKLEGDVLVHAREQLRLVLERALLPDISLELDPAATALVPNEPAELKSRAERVLKPYGFAIESNGASVALEPLVRVRILVAELRKKMMSRIGIQWPGGVEGQLLPTPLFPADGSLRIGLNALEENGLGKILASPTLLCRSGKEAQFLAGGEFPIKIANFKAQDVIWKRYGVLLKIKPQADGAGRMSIAIETEVSMIDAAHTVDGVPGLLTNRIATHFDLASSRTIALSGLIKKEWSEAAQGLPALGSLPILGPLFSSRDYRDDKTELVVFVTPEVVRSDRGGAQ